VSALRNLCERTLSSAIRSVSRGIKLGNLNLIQIYERVSAIIGSSREALKAG
jgi:hypothetical protein